MRSYPSWLVGFHTVWSGVRTPGITLPLSLVIVTSVMVPLVAVTRTGPAGLTPSAAGVGVIDNAAGVEVGTGGGAASTRPRGAATT